MSSKPHNRQQSRRIVPAIPLQLERRAKVNRLADGKSDHPAQDQGMVDHSTEARQNGIEQAAPKKEQAATVSKEAKQASADKKATNGVHEPNAHARPFVAQHRPRQSDALVFGGHQDSCSASPAASSSMFAPPPPPPVAHMPRQMTPYDNVYAASHMPWVGPPQMNGHVLPPTNGVRPHGHAMSPSPSQASSMAPGDSGVGTPDAHAALKQHAPAPSLHMPPGPPLDANVKHLLDFLLDQFARSEFADYVLDLSGPSSKSGMLPVHSVILARYPHILSILHSLPSRRDNYSPALFVHLPQAYYFHDPDAFSDALRYIYGAPLVNPGPLLHGLSPAAASTGEQRASAASRMRYVLSYLATGHSLDVPDITVHGYQIASNMLTWETLEALLSFAVAGFNDDGHGMPTYGYYASQFLQQIVGFLGLNITSDFVLETSVAQLTSLPRLPQSRTPTPERRPRPDSRSSLFATPDAPPAQRIPGIRFGQAPPTESDASLPMQTLSAVLLSMPFFLLKIVLEQYLLIDRLGPEALELLISDVVREREHRRRAALDSLQDKSIADHVLLGEEVAVADELGRRIRLGRSRVAS